MSAPAMWCPPAAYDVADHSRPYARPVPTCAFGRMTDAELSFLAHNSRNPRTVVAAALVLIGRRTAVPTHPPLPTPAKEARP